MASKIEVVIQSALRTFSKFIKRVPEFSPRDINELKSLTDNLTASDIQNLGGLITSRGLKELMLRKMTSLDYLPVYEDNYITVGVFILNEGAKLPLHDHPGMYGIIKVLEGAVKVTSYSFLDYDKTITINDRHLFYNSPLKVVKFPEVLLEKRSESCLLTPTDRNIHEIHCIKGPAAFLDILSPPYEDGEPHEPRVCHYFEEFRSTDHNDNCLRLVQVEKSL